MSAHVSRNSRTRTGSVQGPPGDRGPSPRHASCPASVFLFLPRRTLSGHDKSHPEQPGDLPTIKSPVNYRWVLEMHSSQDLKWIYCHKYHGPPPYHQYSGGLYWGRIYFLVVTTTELGEGEETPHAVFIPLQTPVETALALPHSGSAPGRPRPLPGKRFAVLSTLIPLPLMHTSASGFAGPV